MLLFFYTISIVANFNCHLPGFDSGIIHIEAHVFASWYSSLISNFRTLGHQIMVNFCTL